MDGTIEGNIKVSGHLVVGSTGKIHGNVEALSAVIGGEVIGNVNAPEKTELTSTAKLIGDIRTDAIVIDEKAVFQGKCDMNQEEGKGKRRPVREKRAGRKSARDALREALKEAEAVSAGMDASDDTQKEAETVAAVSIKTEAEEA